MITITNALALASILIFAQPRREPTVPVIKPPTTTTGPTTPVVTPAGTWTYGTLYPITSTSPMPSDAQLRAFFPAGTWIVEARDGTAWMAIQPVPCSPTVTADPADTCFSFFIKGGAAAAQWNGAGFCERRLR